MVWEGKPREGLPYPDYEGVFSNRSSRARYRGRLKVYFQVLMEALVSNLKRLVVIEALPIALG